MEYLGLSGVSITVGHPGVIKCKKLKRVDNRSLNIDFCQNCDIMNITKHTDQKLRSNRFTQTVG